MAWQSDGYRRMKRSGSLAAYIVPAPGRQSGLWWSVYDGGRLVAHGGARLMSAAKRKSDVAMGLHGAKKRKRR